MARRRRRSSDANASTLPALCALGIILVLILGLRFSEQLSNGAVFVCRFEHASYSSTFDKDFELTRSSKPSQRFHFFGAPWTNAPSPSPTTSSPTVSPTGSPTSEPSAKPTVTYAPTTEPSAAGLLPTGTQFGIQAGFEPSRLEVFKPASCYSHLKDLVFVHIPKTGGEAVEKVLGLKKNHYHARARKQKDACWDKKFKFTVVRNPWDRMLSYYFHLRKSLDPSNSKYYKKPLNPKRAWKLATSLEFNAWITKVLVQEPKAGTNEAGVRLMASAYDYLFSPDGHVLVDYIVKFEDLGRDVKRVFRMIGRPNLGLAKLNASKRKHNYRTYYNNHSIALVAKAFAKDVSIFNYTF